MLSFINKIEKQAFFALIIYPLILIYLGVKYYINNSIGFFELGLFASGYYGSLFAVCIGLHRLWAHGSFKTNKVVEFILVMFSAGSLQGPALSWASNHYDHHTYTDKEKIHTHLSNSKANFGDSYGLTWGGCLLVKEATDPSIKSLWSSLVEISY